MWVRNNGRMQAEVDGPMAAISIHQTPMCIACHSLIRAHRKYSIHESKVFQQQGASITHIITMVLLPFGCQQKLSLTLEPLSNLTWALQKFQLAGRTHGCSHPYPHFSSQHATTKLSDELVWQL